MLVILFIPFRAFCVGGLPILGSEKWARLTNTAAFYELHSTTNLPLEIRNFIVKISGPLGIETNDRNRLAEPGEPFTRGSRLIWAVTDGGYYVVHYECVTTPNSHDYYTNYWMAAALPGSQDGIDGTLKCCNGGYNIRFHDYKEFIEYDRKVIAKW